MSSGNDALLALRQAVTSKTTVTYTKDSGPVSTLSAATHIVLSPTSTLPKATPTRLRKPGANGTDPQSNPQDFFALGAVYLAWQLRDASGAEYMKQVRENGYTVGFVSVTERKAVADWVEDKVQELSGLVPAEGEPLFRAASHSRRPTWRMTTLFRALHICNGLYTYSPQSNLLRRQGRPLSCGIPHLSLQYHQPRVLSRRRVLSNVDMLPILQTLLLSKRSRRTRLNSRTETLSCAVSSPMFVDRCSAWAIH